MLRRTMIAALTLLGLGTTLAMAGTDDGPRIERAWARATPGAARTSAAYLRVESPIDDRLVSIATPVARKAELHTHILEDGTMMMREVAGGVALRSHEVLQLEPGGLMHVMLIDLHAPLKAGTRFPLILTFEKAGPREVDVSVEKLGATGPSERGSASDGTLGGPFTLVDQDGRAVSDGQFRGKWMLVYFGYTHCPDACPMALTNMAAALDELDAARRAAIQAIFITVDPARDTPAVMKDYVGAFEDANIVGLTGTPAQVQAAQSAYRVRAKRQALADGDYAMSHATGIHVMDPDGRFIAVVPPDRIAARLAELVP